MSNIERLEESLNKTMDLMDKAGKIFSGFTPHDGFGWDLEQLKGLWRAAQKYLPVKVDDDVTLKKKPVIYGGWACAEHFLIKGAKARVENIELCKEDFYVHLSFYDESWIDHKGKKHPVAAKDRHTFHFHMSDVLKVTP